MKNYIRWMVVIISVFVSTMSYGFKGSGEPLKYMSSCQIDLNGDNNYDIVLLVETLEKQELIATLRLKSGYKTYLLSSEEKGDTILSCHYGKEVVESKAGKMKGRTLKTSGTFIKMVYPEASAKVYFWDGEGFSEVWIAD